MFVQTENWSSLSPDEKLEARFASWMSAEGIQFANPQAEQGYKQRTKMIKDAIQLKKPERIPICPNVGFYPAAYAGVTAEEVMYDYDKLGRAWKKFNTDFMPDSLASSFIVGPGKLFELLDYKLYKWPGHGTAPHTPYQCVEDAYMRDDEYDLLITDPSGYWVRYYMPRILGALNPWQKLAPFTDLVELPFLGAVMVPVGLPDVQKSFESYLEAGRAALEWVAAFGAIDAEMMSTLGLPMLLGGFAKAPFDTIGDTLRGTRAVMLDKFRRPEKLLQAMEMLVPIQIEMGLRTATINNNPFVFIPLHKGADGFLSRNDFAKFYWPTLKAVMLGLISEGAVPYVFVEGGYNQRVDFLADPELPVGKILWIFDQTDMREVKKTLGGLACFGGNVPVSLLKAGTPGQIEAYVGDLIKNVAQDGGFILSTGAVVDDATPENFHAMIAAGKKYGIYQ
ncbi:MAG: uroporphyrinogen decarboxylase family protein [Anaerolineae bacterium]